MKKIIIITTSLLGIGLFLLTVGSLLLLLLAPSPNDIKNYIEPNVTSTSQQLTPKDNTSIEISNTKISNVKTNDNQAQTNTASNSSPTNLNNKKTIDKEQSLALLQLSYLLDETSNLDSEANDNDLCNKIASSTTVIKNKDDALDEWQWREKHPGNKLHPTLHAQLGPIKLLSQQTHIHSVLKSINNPEENIGVIDKAEFYYNITKAIKEMNQSEEELKQKSDAYYLMGILSKAALVSPSIINSKNFDDFCFNLQDSLVNKDKLTKKPDYNEQVNFLENLISSNGLDAKKLGFDKSYIGQTETHAKFNPENGDLSLNISVPWDKALLK